MQPGDRILDRYELLDRIGEGGMGAVFVAKQLSLGREVAVKVLRLDDPGRAEELALRFTREAELAAKVEHRNVVDIIEFGTTEDGHPFLVMPRLRGQPFHQRVFGDPAPSVAEVLEWTVAILSGLAAIHDAGIVHRDLKPANVFLAEDADGVVPKLLDFGMSRGAARAPAGASLTADGAAMGTPQYMAPEQFESARDVDRRADLYSVGAMLYEALTGRTPLTGPDILAIYRAVKTEQPIPLRRRRADLPDALDVLVQRALAKDPGDRFASAREMRDALEPLLSDPHLREVPAGHGPRDAPLHGPGVAPTEPFLGTIPSGDHRPAALTPEAAGGAAPISGVKATLALDQSSRGLPVSTPSVERTVSVLSNSTAALSDAERASISRAAAGGDETPRRGGWLSPVAALAGLLTLGGGVAYALGWLDRDVPPPDEEALVESSSEDAVTPSGDATQVSGVGRREALALRWARLDEAERAAVWLAPVEARIDGGATGFAAFVDRDAPIDVDAVSADLGAEPAPAPAELGARLTPHLTRITVPANVHDQPQISAATLRVTMRDALAVALDGRVDGHPSEPEGDGAMRFVAISPSVGGWVAARYTRDHDGCIPRPPTEACGLDLTRVVDDGSFAETLADVDGRRRRVTVFYGRDADAGESCIAIHAHAAGCQVGERLGELRLPGLLDELFLTETATRGGQSLVVASAHDASGMPADGVLRWTATGISNEVSPDVWTGDVATAAFLPREQRGGVAGSRDRPVRRHSSFATLGVAQPGEDRVFYVWDGERLVTEAEAAGSNGDDATSSGAAPAGRPATDETTTTP